MDSARGRLGSDRTASYVLGVVAVAIVVEVVAFASLTAIGLRALASPYFIALAILLLVTFLSLQRLAFSFEWRGHRTSANMDEAAVLVALLTVPGAMAVVLLPIASVTMAFWSGRSRLKSAFNTAHDAVAAGAAWGVFEGLTALGLPPLFAVLPAPAVFVLVGHLLLSGVFARLEGTSVLRVFRERFVALSAVLAIVGTGAGLAFFALASIHPLAIFALAPFVYLAYRYSYLSARVDAEINVHRTLASVTHALVGKSDLDEVADRVLGTSLKLLNGGSARLKLADTSGAVQSWSRESDAGSAGPVLAVPLPARGGGTLGTLEVQGRPAQKGFGDLEHALAHIIAGQAAGAVENARALIELEKAREDALETHDLLSKQEKLATVGTLVAGVAHEVGNPLTYIRGSVELTLAEADRLAASGGPEKAAGERIRADLASVLEGVDRVLEITESLKSVARQGPAGRRVVDASDVARDVARVVRAGLPRSLKLELDVASDPAPVRANPGELSQVVLNLVKNAAEAIGAKPGRVTVRTRAIGDRAFIVVEDDGPGIPPEVQGRLFQAFFTTKEKGTGLGLNISKRIVEEHGGRLVLRSAPGAGTTFTLELPRVQEESTMDASARDSTITITSDSLADRANYHP